MKVGWWHWRPRLRWRVIGAVSAADEVPSRLPRNTAILVGSRRSPKWLGFDCPCRKGHRILLNLDQQRTPHWHLGSERRVTLSPSIDSFGPNGRCHYFIKRGRVIWV